MSNFQRTRSKVWWGDSPPNIGSPVAHASNWESRFRGARVEDDWEPQLPCWSPEAPVPQVIEESPPLPAINIWSPRQSPGSHKSQDSGFSDSDSSPSTNQQNNSKDKSNKDQANKDNGELSNNGDAQCCHNDNEAENAGFKTPAKRDLSNNVLNYLQTPRSSINKFHSGTPIRSLIKTPKDVQDYLEAHCDNGHRTFDSIKTEEDSCINMIKSNTIKVVVTPNKNINNNNVVFEKCTTKKNLLETFNNIDDMKDADIIDGKKVSADNVNSNIEYIQLSPSHQIAVNNQPRMRSPIARISYHPPVHFVSKDTSPGQVMNLTPPKKNSFDLGNEMQTDKDEEYGFRTNQPFQRNGLNRSFNYIAQRADDDEGSHSLGYIEVMRQQEFVNNKQDNKTTNKDEEGTRAFSSRNITDTLNLKTPKKSSMSRTKQKIQSKASKAKQSPKINKSFFNFLPKKNDSIKTIYDITRGSVESDRVPSLGLPRSHIENDWEIIGHSSNENIQNDDERYIDQNNLNTSTMSNPAVKSPKGILKAPGSCRKITPPPQFQDPNHSLPVMDKIYYETSNYRKNNSISEGIFNSASNFNRQPSNEDIHFCEQELNAACTSTPKTLLSPDYLPNTARTARNTARQGMKPVNLLSNFNESARLSTHDIDLTLNSGNPTTPLEKICVEQSAPVQHWLCDLVGLYEPECMTTLQSKALGMEMNKNVASSSATITGNIRKVQTHGQIIAHQFKQVMKDLQTVDSYIVHQRNSEINTMISNINEFILAHSITLKIKPPGETPDRWDKIKKALQNNIQKVLEVTEDVQVELNETRPELNVLQKNLKTLLDIFVETARAVLVQQMRTLVSMLEDPPSDMILKSTLTSLGHLGALMSPEGDIDIADPESEAMKFITELPFVDCGVPRALLSVIIESNKSSIKALSLRALATICVTSEAVQQFEEAGGIEILSDILSEESNPEPQMREAVTVLTQITAPWLQGDYRLKQLDTYLETIIKNITGVLSRTSCCQLLLLCTACLVNLVNLVKQKERQLSNKENEEKHGDIIEILTKNKTVENLLEAVKRRGPSASVFLQEQTATLINSVSSSSRGRVLLAACHAVAVALVCFLRCPRASPARQARLQAEFRLVNQAAEALARLCTIPEITVQIIQLEGASRLVRVIKAQKLQKTDGKCSDQILVNCLRAVRAIAKTNRDCFRDVECDVTDMIRPSLMESVKIYSAKQESYV